MIIVAQNFLTENIYVPKVLEKFSISSEEF